MDGGKTRRRSYRRKPVNGCRLVDLARPQHRCRELRFVGRVREVLGLQTEGASSAVGRAAFAGETAVEEIRRIELDTGLACQNLHHTTGGRFDDPGRER